MKNIFIIMLIFSALITQAQEKLPPPNLHNAVRIFPTTQNVTIPCSGSANPQSIDLKWKPILSKKYTESDNESPNQDYIDSVKAYKLKLKQEYESEHHIPAERTTIVTPTVGATFSGYATDNSRPLDNSMAISNGGKIVSVENKIISYWNTSGTPLGGYTILSFLSAYFTPYDVCDPVVIYDPNYDRFIFFCQEINAGGLFSNNRIFICFSKSNNPSVDGWYYYSWTGDPTGSNNGFDYPKMAINDSELFVSGNLFTIGTPNVFHQAVLFQLNKLAGYSGGSVGGITWTGFTGSPSTLLPVSWGQNGDITTGMLLVSTSAFGGSTINEYQIVGNWCCSPSMYYSSISTTPYSISANALQSGTSCKLQTNDCRSLSGFYLDTIIHFVFHSDYGSGYSGINYNRLNIYTGTNTSSLVGALGYDFAYPSVASFATTATDKSVMIGFGLSGSSIHPKICAVNCDNSMLWSPYTTVQNSSTYILYVAGDTIERWGDYTGMSRYNSSATSSVWMNGMFGNTSGHWQTWIAEIGGTPIICATPVGLSASAITTTSATLNWAAATGAVSYNVQYRKVGTSTWSSTSTSATSVTITGLTASTTYEFQVETVCSAGVSSWSVLFDFTTLSTASCGTPTILTTTSITTMSATLNWTAVAGAISYNVRYRIGAGSWTTLTGITPTATALTGLTPNTLYEFEVQAVCSSLTGIWSGLSSFTTLTALGIASNQNSSSTKVFPNPITNTFSVEFSLSEDVNLDIAVIDVNGKVVKELYNGIGTTGDNVFSFDKSNLASGVYFLVIKSNSQTIKNEKIVVN